MFRCEPTIRNFLKWRGGLLVGGALYFMGCRVHELGFDIELKAAIGHERHELHREGIWARPIWLAGLATGARFKRIGRPLIDFGARIEKWARRHWHPDFTSNWDVGAE